MSDDGIFDTLRHQFEARYGQPIEAAVMVHRSRDQAGATGPRRLFAKGAAKDLHINNYLCLTPTHLRLAGLGGRTGVKPKDDVAAWDRRTATIEVADAARAEWMASYWTSYDYDVHALRISGPELTLVVDVMAENHLMDPRPQIQRMLDACAHRPEEAR